jgi:hypothetical protein
VFSREGTNYAQQAKITPGVDGTASDAFGAQLALDGDLVLIGSPSDEAAGQGAGSVYVFLLGDSPTITTQPVSRTVLPGVPLSFSVEVTGYAPLRYQWRKNGFEIPGETRPTYSIASVAESDAGRYDVVISNLGGTATSAVAILAVNALSEFAQAAPAAPPEAQGFLLVNLSPTGIGGAWRFFGEQQWRSGGVPVGGLVSGNRQIEYRPVPGFYQPLREPVSIVSGAAATVVDREYFTNGDPATGGLSVTLLPTALAGTGWRLLGDDTAPWQASGDILARLLPGVYLVELQPVAGYAAPPSISVTVVDGQTTTASAT